MVLQFLIGDASGETAKKQHNLHSSSESIEFNSTVEALSQGVVGLNTYGAHSGVESYTQSVAPQSVGPIHVHAVLVLAVAGRALSPVCPVVHQGTVLHPPGRINDTKY